MIRIVEKMTDGKIMIESDEGKMLDIGGGAVKRLIISESEMEYVDETEPDGDGE